jgi:hypothetical protein
MIEEKVPKPAVFTLPGLDGSYEPMRVKEVLLEMDPVPELFINLQNGTIPQNAEG